MRYTEYAQVMDFVHPIEAVIPGAQGRVLATLTGTTAELNLRTLARLSRISAAQASRVLPGLVSLGLVERREVPPSSQFRLNRANIACRALLALAGARGTVLEELGQYAGFLATPPASVVVFGSLARGEATEHSDIDVVLVRPDTIDEDDDGWASGVEQWKAAVRASTGNRVEVIETSQTETREHLRGKAAFWKAVQRDGIVVHGATLDQLAHASAHG